MGALGWGATFANHPVAMACAYECVKFTVKEKLPERAAAQEVVMVEEMQKLVEEHSCVRQARAIGLFGCLDLINEHGNFIQEYQQPQSPKTQAFRQGALGPLPTSTGALRATIGDNRGGTSRWFCP